MGTMPKEFCGRIFPLCLWLGIVILLTNINTSCALNNVESIQYILRKFNNSRNSEYSWNSKEDAKRYIQTIFQKQGYQTTTESFTVRGINGINVVARKNGRFVNTVNDRIFIVGAHYDTYRKSFGVDDSGSGLTAMLQVARQYSDKDMKCEQNGTIVFVAFDQAQTCTCHNFTCCYQGSQAFIKQFTDELGLNKGQIEGAVILDSIMNFDRTPNIQNLTVLDQITDLSIRNVIKQIERDGNRGDFLMAVGRQDGDNELLKNLTTYYNKGPNYLGDFKLREFSWPLQQPPSEMGERALYNYQHLFNGDHYRFWNNKPVVNAILLTDSAYLRGYMRYCYRNDCDDYTHVTTERAQFMGNIVDAVAMMARDITGHGHCTPTLLGNITKQLYGVSGEFTSPGYPNHYPNKADSVWYISVPSQYSYIKLTFSDFDLERSECTNDVVDVYDGYSDRLLLGRYCGKDPLPGGIRTKTRYMKVKFKSDAYDTYKGFKARWQAAGATAQSVSQLLLSITLLMVFTWT